MQKAAQVHGQTAQKYLSIALSYTLKWSTSIRVATEMDSQGIEVHSEGATFITQTHRSHHKYVNGLKKK